MPKQTVEEKAHAYLLAGKVRVIEHDYEAGRAEIEVYGSAPEPYMVRFARAGAAGLWHCDCPAKVENCSHLIAAKLISPLTHMQWTMKVGHSAVDELLGLTPDNSSGTLDK
jgi:hypothetical protein